MKSKSLWVIGLLWLALFFGVMSSSGTVYAQSEGAEQKSMSFLNDVLSIKYRDTDLAHVSFARMFGGFVFDAFGGGPENAPTTALAKVLGYTNVIAMILGVVILSYVIVGGAINTAATGELLGRSWSSVWLPARSMLAFGMIMPSSSGDQVFSVAQSVVMWMVILGSNGGTWLWEKGSTELALGAPVSTSTSFYDANQSDSIVEILNCAASRMKMYVDVKDSRTVSKGIGNAVQKTSPLTSVEVPITMNANGLVLPSHYNYLEFFDCGTITMPSLASLGGTSEASTEETVWNGIFGRSKLDWEKQLVGSFSEALPAALTTYINNVAKLVHEINTVPFTSKSIDAVLTEVQQDRGPQGDAIEAKLTELAGKYARVEQHYVTYHSTMLSSLTENNEAVKAWKTEIHKGGWMRAGAWFFEATRYQGLTQTLMSQVSDISSVSGRKGNSFMCNFTSPDGEGNRSWIKRVAGKLTGCEERMNKLTEHLNVLVAVQHFTKLIPDSTADVTGHTAGGGKGTTVRMSGLNSEGNLDPNITKRLSEAATHVVLNGLIYFGCDNAVGGSSSKCSDMTTDTSGLTSPFTMLSSIGHGLIGLSTIMWGIGLIGVTVAGVMSGLGWTGVTGGIGAFGYYLIGSMMAAVAGIVSMGFMFAYLLPFMPVMAWIMIIIGYLINVIEALAAAPLAVVMLATPEGEGLSGANAQRAIQLVNAIILKPSLFIVGLFAAMTVGYIGFSLINNLFWSVASMQNGFALFNFIATMILYTGLCFRCVQAMVNVMSAIPNQILEWMAGGIAREFGSNINEEMGRMPGVGGGGELSSTKGFDMSRKAMGRNRKPPKPKP